MPHPGSSFESGFDVRVLLELGGDPETTAPAIQNGRFLPELLEWLCVAPRTTSYRVNTLRDDAEGVRRQVEARVRMVLGDTAVKVEVHPVLKEAIVIYNWESSAEELVRHEKEVIVCIGCSAAVLRGAHVYAPGVLGMMSGTKIGDRVSIYSDVAKKCKKGLRKLYGDSLKVFVGNGVVEMDRSQLFCENPLTMGVAVRVTETTSNCPPIGDDFLHKGVALLQNLPSIICVRVLDPQPGEAVLDMCASPGNKTTHIAALMQNQGRLVAVDKTVARVVQLRRTLADFSAEAEVHQADSTKILVEGPKFQAETFDRILLDAPCSGLGKRPQLLVDTSVKVLRSYVPLQRKLFESAAQLLKQNGVLVYSTCTITLSENEGIVAWALRTFDCLELAEPTPSLGGPGLEGAGLTEAQMNKVQRFGPGQQVDSVGFFIAKFVKKRPF